MLQDLRKDSNLFFPDTNKGLGPCSIMYDQYVADCLIRLSDKSIFKQHAEVNDWQPTRIWRRLSRLAQTHQKRLWQRRCLIHQKSCQWKYDVSFGQFFYLVQDPQGTNQWLSPHPVCSNISCLPHGLRKLIDCQLQPVAYTQTSCINDGFALNTLLNNVDTPPNALLFGTDASQFTHKDRPCPLDHLTTSSHKGKVVHPPYDSRVLVKALKLVFQDNLVQFLTCPVAKYQAPEWGIPCGFLGNHLVCPTWKRIPPTVEVICNLLPAFHWQCLQHMDLWWLYRL